MVTAFFFFFLTSGWSSDWNLRYMQDRLEREHSLTKNYIIRNGSSCREAKGRLHIHNRAQDINKFMLRAAALPDRL